MKFKYYAIIVIQIACLGLFVLGVVNRVQIEGDPALSADGRLAAIYRHSSFWMHLGTMSSLISIIWGLWPSGWGASSASPSKDSRLDSQLDVLRNARDAQQAANEASRATVIALDEPNISLKITLTGDAAKDAVGRKKIGAVTEHYASGSAVANVSETIGTGPVTSEVLRALDKGGAA